MDSIYKSTSNNIANYMYPKHNITLPISAVAEEAIEEEIPEAAAPVEEPLLTRGEANSMKKADLINAIKLQYGDDADVTGTKAELLDRFYPGA